MLVHGPHAYAEIACLILLAFFAIAVVSLWVHALKHTEGS